MNSARLDGPDARVTTNHSSRILITSAAGALISSMIGSVLAHYEIEALLGAGGMGVVYRAYDQKLRRQVAIKFLGDSTEGETRAKLFREARTASALNHPNICTIYEVGEAEGRTYIVMEYVQGTLLSTLIPPWGLAPEAFSRSGCAACPFRSPPPSGSSRSSASPCSMAS